MPANPTSPLQRLPLFGCLCAALLCLTAPALAQDEPMFEVEQVSADLRDGVYRVNADLMLRLSDPVREALSNGVPLYINIDLRLIRERGWWTDEILAELSQRYLLEYFELSQQYLVVNLNTEVRELFPDIDTALAYMGLLVDFPLIDQVLIDKSSSYVGEIRARLDLGRLPLPLLPNAYFSSDWNLASPWFQWRLK